VERDVTGVLACPGADEVHLWQAPLNLDPAELAVLDRFLSTDERERAERFRLDRDGARYTAARGWLRWLIGRYLDVDPSGLSFGKGAFGKPELTNPAVSWLRFNLAHSADLAVFAISSRREIGVDIEHIRADFPVEAVAQRFLPPEEWVALASLPPDRRTEAFFSLWTRKEAYLKAIGVGLAAIDADVKPNGGHCDEWLLTAFVVGDGYAAAVAVEGRSVRVPAAAQPLRLTGS
jgi:4'-phosphopantetheinyl transferase